MKLMIHDRNFLGDTLLSSPVYKAFKDAGHEVHSLGRPEQRELLEGNPYIDKIWTPKNQWLIIPELRRERFDYTMQLNTSFKTNLFLSTLNSVSIGYSYKWAGLPLDIKIPIKHRTCRVGNRIEEIDDLIFSAFGLRLEPKMIFKVPQINYKFSHTVCIHPCSGRHKKLRQWDINKWAHIADEIIKMGLNIDFIGSSEDDEYIRLIQGSMTRGWFSANKTEMFTIKELAQHLEASKLLITVNSFPMHLGISQGTPTLALIGRTPKEVIVHPSVKNFWYLEDPAIFDKNLKPMNFTVEEVLEKVKECLNRLN